MYLIDETVADLSGNHALDPTTDYCKARGDCKLKSGHEVTFVSLLADYLFQAIKKEKEQDLDYHRWIYMPSRRAEYKVGYDLSIGRFDGRRRVRSMHKLLLRWCDRLYRKSINPGSSDHRHLKALFRDYRASTAVRPYLIINTCYCIHEYRRMGCEFDGFLIPDIESLLRTVIVPLRELFMIIMNDRISIENISLRYYRNSNKRLPDEEPSAFLNRLADPKNHHAVAEVHGEVIRELDVLDLTEWRDEAVAFLLSEDVQ